MKQNSKLTITSLSVVLAMDQSCRLDRTVRAELNQMRSHCVLAAMDRRDGVVHCHLMASSNWDCWGDPNDLQGQSPTTPKEKPRYRDDTEDHANLCVRYCSSVGGGRMQAYFCFLAEYMVAKFDNLVQVQHISLLHELSQTITIVPARGKATRATSLFTTN
jgi:hypothetical protein